MPGKGGPHGRSGGPPGTAAATSWDHVADWYDKLVGDEGSDYHRNVVLPAALRMLAPQQDERVMDLCCGQGVFARLVAQTAVGQVVGVDASPALIEAAKQRGGSPKLRYYVADARDLRDLATGNFDGVGCLMAVHDIDDIEAMFRSMADALRPGGRAVLIFMHPCFRVPRQSSWGWDDQKKTQYRRLDRYSAPMTIPISMHPGIDPGTHTLFFHRPLAAYLTALGKAGLGVVACEELISHHKASRAGTAGARTAPARSSRSSSRSRQSSSRMTSRDQ